MYSFMITKKQERVLQEIARYIRKNGLSPSIQELQKILGLKSRQPAVNYLRRLQKAGLIVRATESVRSITLTEEGATVAGEISKSKNASGEKRINRDLVERLKELDPYLAQCYISAWTTFELREIPNRLSGAAHQMRNIGYLIADRQKPSQKQRIHDLAEHIRKSIVSIEQMSELENLIVDFESTNKKLNIEAYLKLVDPRGYRTIDFDRSAISRLKELTNTLSNISHDDSKTNEDDVGEMMSEYERVLLLVTKKQASILDSIDRLLGTNPNITRTKELGELISLNPNSRDYFFKNLNIIWLRYLEDQQELPFTFLSPTDELGRALARLADQDAQAVANVVLRVPLESCRSFFVSDILGVIEKFDQPTRLKLVDFLLKLLKLSEEKHIDWDFLSIFLKKDAVLNDSDLREKIFVNVLDKAVAEDTEDISSSDRTDVIEAARALLGADDQRSALILLANSLHKYLGRRLVERSSLIFSMDRSQNDHLGFDVIDNLVFILVDGVVSLLSSTKNDKRKEVIAGIFPSVNKGLMMRIKLYILMRFKDDLYTDAVQALFDTDITDDAPKEWGELLADLYPTLSNTEKQAIREKIVTVPTNQPKERSDYEKAERFHWIADHIDLDTLEPDVSQIIQTKDLSPQPIFRSWSGPESPISVHDIKQMSTDKLRDFLRDYVQSGDGWFSHSREGLGRNLQQAIEDNGSQHIALLAAKNLSQLEPVYVAHALMAYEKLAKSNSLSADDIHAVISAFDSIVDQKMDLIKAEDPSDDRGDSNSWRFALRGCGYFIQTILQKDVSLSQDEQNAIWRFVRVLATHPDPTPQYEKEYFKDVRDEMSLSLNCVRGIGLTAAIYFFLYQKRNCGLTEVPDAMRFVVNQAAQSGSANDGVVIGRYSPWLFHSDKIWFTGIWKTLMASTNDAVLAAWKGFLVSRLDPEMFELMDAQYKQSIERVLNFRENDKGHFSVSEHHSIPEHMVYATAFDYPNARTMMRDVLTSKGKNKNAFLEAYLSFFGRAIFQRDAGLQNDFDIEYAKTIISEILKSTTSEAVHSAFGWCVNASALPVIWLLDNLLVTLDRTGGKIEASHVVFKFLKESVQIEPLKSLEVLFLLISGTLRDIWVVSAHREDILSVLKIANEISKKDDDKDMIAMIEKIKDYLLRQGYNDFRF